MKKKLPITKLTGICLILLLISSVSAQAQLKTPDITGTKEIYLKLACKLTIIQGEKASLEITGDEDALNDVHVKMMGDKLKIYNEENHQDRSDVSVTITLPDLNKISIAGPVNVTTPSTLNLDELLVDVSGVADFNLKLKSKVLRLNSSGVLSGEIHGETEALFIEISGVGKFNATEFRAKNCKVDVSGVGRVAVNATDHLDASVSGMGKIQFTGNPKINAHSSGIGSIDKID